MSETTSTTAPPAPAPEPVIVPEPVPAQPPVVTTPVEPVKVVEQPSDDFIQFDLIVGKHGGRKVKQGIVVSKDVAKRAGKDLTKMITKQLSRQVSDAVEEIITLEEGL